MAGNWAGCWNLEPEFSSQNGYYLSILQALKRGCSTGCCLNDFVLRLSVLNGL